MKKEIIAGILLMLLFAAGLINTRVSERDLTALEQEIDTAYELASAGMPDSARSQLDAAIERWNALEDYTRIFIGHADVDTVNMAIYLFRSDLDSGNMGRIRGSYSYLIGSIDDMISTERLSLRSVF